MMETFAVDVAVLKDNPIINLVVLLQKSYYTME